MLLFPSSLIKLASDEFIDDLNKFSRSWDMGNGVSSPGFFVQRGEVFLIDNRQDDITYKIRCSDDISYKISNNSTEFTAHQSGYLYLYENRLSIVSPIIISGDKLYKKLILIPLIYGFDELVNFIGEFGITYDNKSVITITLEEGEAAIEGENAYIKELYKCKYICENNGNIDFKKSVSFIEVKKGDILTRKYRGRRGRDGVDIFGDPIIGKKGEDIEYRAGDNVEEINSDDGISTLFISKVNGIVEYSRNNVSVKRVLTVPGNVSNETGSISYSGDIEIKGDIKPGFRVFCGGNLRVDGSVENGATILCRGNSEIGRGIIGEKTYFKCEGSLLVEFIQDCNIRVLGELRVLNSIYNSTVFSGKSIEIEGNRNRSRSHGAIVSSRVSSMDSIKTLSAGSVSNNCHLISGIDLELIEMVKSLNGVMPILKKKQLEITLKINRGYGRSLDPEYIKELPKAKRARLKDQLELLKALVIRQGRVEKKVNEISPKIQKKDLSKNLITVTKELYQDTLLQIGYVKKRVTNKKSGVSYSLEDRRIVESKV